MKVNARAPSGSGSKNNTRDCSLAPSRASAAGRSPPLSPPKSWAWWIEQDGCHVGPRTCGGTAVNGEATDGDGDENSSRVQSATLGTKEQREELRTPTT